MINKAQKVNLWDKALHMISPIKTVDAIDSEHSFLLFGDLLTIVYIIDGKKSKLFDILSDKFDQSIETFSLESQIFVVIVIPQKLWILTMQRSKTLFKYFSKPSFSSYFID